MRARRVLAVLTNGLALPFGEKVLRPGPTTGLRRPRGSPGPPAPGPLPPAPSTAGVRRDLALHPRSGGVRGCRGRTGPRNPPLDAGPGGHAMTVLPATSGRPRTRARAVLMHDNQLHPTATTVRALVAAQFPAWAGLPVRRVAAQVTVNALFRIGDRLLARLPLRAADPSPLAAGSRPRRPGPCTAAPGSRRRSRSRSASPVPATRCRGWCRPGCPGGHLLEAGPRQALRDLPGCGDVEYPFMM